MSYLDEELIKDLRDHNILFDILSESEHISIVRKINANIPFSGSKVAWSNLNTSMNLGREPSDFATLRLAEEIRKVADSNLIFVGDSACDEAYSISIEYLEITLKIFSELPQHTYIVTESLTWIACISFEGDLDFANIL